MISQYNDNRNKNIFTFAARHGHMILTLLLISSIGSSYGGLFIYIDSSNGSKGDLVLIANLKDCPPP